MSIKVRSLPIREESHNGIYDGMCDAERLARADEKLLRVADVCEIVRVHRATWHRWVRQGIAPKPIKFGGSTFWTLTSVRRFMQEIIDAASD